MSYVLIVKMIISGIWSKLTFVMDVFDNFMDSGKSNGNQLNEVSGDYYEIETTPQPKSGFIGAINCDISGKPY